MPNEEKFVFESMQDTRTVQSFLDALVEGFGKERIVLATDGSEISLSPSGLLNVSIKARKKDGATKLSVKVAWKECDRGKKAGDNEIRVSS
jgi:amphi-Trp domain-containing protein